LAVAQAWRSAAAPAAIEERRLLDPAEAVKARSRFLLSRGAGKYQGAINRPRIFKDVVKLAGSVGSTRGLAQPRSG